MVALVRLLFGVIKDLPRAGGEIAGVLWLDAMGRGLNDFCCNPLAISAFIFSNLKFDYFAGQSVPEESLFAIV